MPKLSEIYKCELCGNVVSLVEEGDGELVCCGQPMILLEEKTSEQEGQEKHVPVIETSDKGIIVKVGSVPHPMLDDHYIEMIQLVKDGQVMMCKRLKPGSEPVAEFPNIEYSEELKARVLCNIHGLWKN